MNTSKPTETNKQPLVVKRGEEETIKALGSEITFLCREPGAWSLTRVSVPRDVGAPPHDHDFDESYYVLSGSLRLMVAGKEVELDAGECSFTSRAKRSTASRGPPTPRRRS
jgi:mannose-6-phosphate isomerase-like protein (cupin superfamily)